MTHCEAFAASIAVKGLTMYDLYDHVTADSIEPRPILNTNFLCHFTNLER